MKTLILSAAALLTLTSLANAQTDVSNDTVKAANAGSAAGRALSSITADTVNAKNLGALLNGTAADEANIQTVYSAAPHDGIIDLPIGLWPVVSGSPYNPDPAYNSSNPGASKSVFWHALGTIDLGSGSSPGTNPVLSIGDGDLTESYANATNVAYDPADNYKSLNFFRTNLTQIYTSPNVLVQFDNYSSNYSLLSGYNVYANVPALKVNSISEAGSHGSLNSLFVNLNSNGTDGTSSSDPSQDQGINLQVQRHGTNSTWQISGQTVDSTGTPPTTPYSTIGTELDIQANGPDNASSLYQPETSARYLLYLAGKEYSGTPAYKTNTAYSVGATIMATSTGEVSTIYIVTTAGTTGSSAPTWPTSGSVTDSGGVVWAFSEVEAPSYGAAIWLDGGGSNDDSYNSGIATNAHYGNAILDLAGGTLLKSSSAGIRMAANMPIDFSADDKSNSSKNNHFLEYSSSVTALIYSVNGSTMDTFANNGNFSADQIGNAAGVTSGYPNRGLTIGTNISNGNLEADLITGPNGAAFYATDGSGNISSPYLSATPSLVKAAEQFSSPLSTPASSSASCSAGTKEADSNYLYVCTATNTWKRAALSSF